MRPEARQRLVESDRQQRLQGELYEVEVRHSRAPFGDPQGLRKPASARV